MRWISLKCILKHADVGSVPCFFIIILVKVGSMLIVYKCALHIIG